jgi:hypothetical protein
LNPGPPEYEAGVFNKVKEFRTFTKVNEPDLLGSKIKIKTNICMKSAMICVQHIRSGLSKLWPVGLI